MKAKYMYTKSVTQLMFIHFTFILMIFDATREMFFFLSNKIFQNTKKIQPLEILIFIIPRILFQQYFHQRMNAMKISKEMLNS